MQLAGTTTIVCIENQPDQIFSNKFGLNTQKPVARLQTQRTTADLKQKHSPFFPPPATFVSVLCFPSEIKKRYGFKIVYNSSSTFIWSLSLSGVFPW